MNPNKYTKLTREDPRRGTIDQAKSKRHFFSKTTRSRSICQFSSNLGPFKTRHAENFVQSRD